MGLHTTNFAYSFMITKLITLLVQPNCGANATGHGIPEWSMELWPDADFSLPMPINGCPRSWGIRTETYHQTLIGGTDQAHHRSVQIGSNSFSLNFCVHKRDPPDGVHSGLFNFTFDLPNSTQKGNNEYDTSNWPEGQYCVSKNNHYDCPDGLESGGLGLGVTITNDSRHYHNKSAVYSRLGNGKGRRRAKSLLKYCCNWSGNRDNVVSFPTAKPFYLYPTQGNRCQKVKGMNSRQEYLQWELHGEGGQVTMPHGSGRYSYHTFHRNYSVVTRYLCYYTKIVHSNTHGEAASPTQAFWGYLSVAAMGILFLSTPCLMIYCLRWGCAKCPPLGQHTFRGRDESNRRSSGETMFSSLSTKLAGDQGEAPVGTGRNSRVEEVSLNAIGGSRKNSSQVHVPENQNLIQGLIQTEIAALSSLLTSRLSVNVKEYVSSIMIPRSTLMIMEKVGQGAFGNVWKASHQPFNSIRTRVVAIKIMKESSSNMQVQKFVEEALTMAEFDHPHVLSLIGVSVDNDSGLPLIVSPFMSNGDLQTYLRRYRYDKDLSDQTPDSIQLLTFSLHVARGLNYLTQLKFVHRDLACRNCMYIVQWDWCGFRVTNSSLRAHVVMTYGRLGVILPIASYGKTTWADLLQVITTYAQRLELVAHNPGQPLLVDENLCVKIADFGLTKDIYDSCYYRQPNDAAVPIRWMAPESILDMIYTSKSDMWSLGVTVWEIYSLGCVPYAELENRDILGHLTAGHRLHKPAACTDEMYSVLLNTWVADPSQRPSSAAVCDNFEQYLEKKQNYVGLCAFHNTARDPIGDLD